MKVSELKEEIRDKYGSVRRFCKIVDFDYWRFQNITRNGTINLTDLNTICDIINNSDNIILKDELSPNLRKEIRIKIYTHYKNIKDFCDQHDINVTTMSLIINGHAVKKTAIVKKVCSILNINDI